VCVDFAEIDKRELKIQRFFVILLKIVNCEL